VDTPKDDSSSVASSSLTAPFKVRRPSPPLLKFVLPEPFVPKSHKSLLLSKNWDRRNPLPSPSSLL
jgi:hypothetical protein